MDNSIVYDLPHHDYHAMTDRISNSYLSRLAICPASAKIKQEETPAMTLGRALHSFILDGPAAFGREFSIIPNDAPKSPSITQLNAKKPSDETIKAIEWWAAFNNNNIGRVIISSDDLKSITEMDRAVKSHPTARKLIGTGATEVSIFWTDSFSGLPCKARPDLIPGNIGRTLIDLKKTRDASPHAFMRSVVTYGYHRQSSFYLDGMKKVTGEEYDLFAFIAVEDKEPFRVEVYTLSPTFIERGRTEVQMLLTVELNCRSKNEWPNYQSAQATELEMPKYMAYQEEG
jgi:hypothetical protein